MNKMCLKPHFTIKIQLIKVLLQILQSQNENVREKTEESRIKACPLDRSARPIVGCKVTDNSFAPLHLMSINHSGFIRKKVTLDKRSVEHQMSTEVAKRVRKLTW